MGVVTWLGVLTTLEVFRAGGVEYGLTGAFRLLCGTLFDAEAVFLAELEGVTLDPLAALADFFFLLLSGVDSSFSILRVSILDCKPLTIA